MTALKDHMASQELRKELGDIEELLQQFERGFVNEEASMLIIM